MWCTTRSTQQGSGSKKSKDDHHNYSYFVHRTTVEVYMSPWLSAGTHSPHTPLQPRAVHASADTASSSGAHTHAELLRLPSISRRREGARVVVVVDASALLSASLGASGAVVVVVFVVGAFVVVVVVVFVFAVGRLASSLCLNTSGFCSELFTTDLLEFSVKPLELVSTSSDSACSVALSPFSALDDARGFPSLTALTGGDNASAPTSCWSARIIKSGDWISRLVPCGGLSGSLVTAVTVTHTDGQQHKSKHQQGAQQTARYHRECGHSVVWS
ncbi:hypothetical protein TcG_10801 [Trypanosoma cruzi]|nr:hypothetical protein TcG_10801 [Trypanosoma cruzi]